MLRQNHRRVKTNGDTRDAHWLAFLSSDGSFSRRMCKLFVLPSEQDRAKTNKLDCINLTSYNSQAAGMFFQTPGVEKKKITDHEHVFLRMILHCASNYTALSRNWSLLRHTQRYVSSPPAPVVPFPASISSGRKLLRAGKWSSVCRCAPCETAAECSVSALRAIF